MCCEVGVTKPIKVAVVIYAMALCGKMIAFMEEDEITLVTEQRKTILRSGTSKRSLRCCAMVTYAEILQLGYTRFIVGSMSVLIEAMETKLMVSVFLLYKAKFTFPYLGLAEVYSYIGSRRSRIRIIFRDRRPPFSPRSSRS